MKDFSYGFQTSEEQEFPVVVQIALEHYICNSNCLKCPVGLSRRGQMGQDKTGEFDPRKKAFFPWKLFPKIADEIAKYPWSILRFHGRGEPLMHPHYIDMAKYAKKAGVKRVTSFTNVILLDDTYARNLLDTGIDLLELSIDAASEKLYQQFRGTNYFQTVVKNAINLIRLRNSGGYQTRIIVSAVDCPEFQEEKETFLNYWNKLADMTIVRPYHTYGGRLAPIGDQDRSKVVPCAQLWTRFSINPWGQVNACFNDWADHDLVGDLNDPDQTIARIWQNDKFQAIRQSSLDGHADLACCGICLATKESWFSSYQVLIDKLFAKDPNWTL